MKSSAAPVLRRVESETLALPDIAGLILDALIQRYFASSCVGHELRVHPSPHPGSFETENARDRWYTEDAVYFRFREMLRGLCCPLDGRLVLVRTYPDRQISLICDLRDDVIVLTKKN